jgi:hypothetical protein
MEVMIFKFLLILTNFVILTYLLLVAFRHYAAKVDKQSWGFIFHLITIAWLIVRGAFWISTITHFIRWTTLSFYLLYWMPAPFEFAGYMILPLFFAQVLYPTQWKKYWSTIRPFYFVIIIGIIVFQALWAWLAATPTVRYSLLLFIYRYLTIKSLGTKMHNSN